MVVRPDDGEKRRREGKREREKGGEGGKIKGTTALISEKGGENFKITRKTCKKQKRKKKKKENRKKKKKK